MLSRTSSRTASSLLRSASNSSPAHLLPAITTTTTTALRTESPFLSSRKLRRGSSAKIYYRRLHSTPVLRKGITPGSADPAPPKVESSNPNIAGGANHVMQPSPLTDEQYREYSEHYFNLLLSQIEQLQEDGSDVEAEYSAGVINITVPNSGVYVLNKQPPNKQIWLSSPLSGPKRYDWVVQGDHMDEKEGTREFIKGQWIYLRDGSNLTTLLNEELNLGIKYDVYEETEV
ncbi:iron donor protein CyaY [Paracoccidioides brasiliensis]|uniref:ferroxidase n=1 Tax=Paracoccidioides brasiliensis TaxID=121759 RepID=A0A1D2JQG2_PARBR|nr:iron donor protein CyaY [Paracoccidioides brasiliensis]ODH49313.1 iron donor protein CyaY [Paracoccidioides brasiliensis]